MKRHKQDPPARVEGGGERMVEEEGRGRGDGGREGGFIGVLSIWENARLFEHSNLLLFLVKK